MEISEVGLDLFYFLLATPLGDIAILLAGGLILAGLVDSIISAVGVIRE